MRRLDWKQVAKRMLKIKEANESTTKRQDEATKRFDKDLHLTKAAVTDGMQNLSRRLDALETNTLRRSDVLPSILV